MLKFFRKTARQAAEKSTILIYADMEGVCGVTEWNEVTPGTKEYLVFQEYMTNEVNAAIEGAFLGGAGRVLVNDLHWHYDNLIWHCLNPRAEIYRGANLVLDVLEQEKIDGLFLIGFHAMAQTKNSILPHTWALPGHLNALYVNGEKIGEIGMIAYAGFLKKIPLILVTGDEACFQEVDQVSTHCQKVCVKKIKNDQLICYPENKKIKEIKKASQRAVKSLMIKNNKGDKLNLSSPFEWILDFPSETMAKKAQHISYEVVRYGTQIHFTVSTYRQGLDLFFDSLALTFLDE